MYFLRAAALYTPLLLLCSLSLLLLNCFSACSFVSLLRLCSSAPGLLLLSFSVPSRLLLCLLRRFCAPLCSFSALLFLCSSLSLLCSASCLVLLCSFCSLLLLRGLLLRQCHLLRTREKLKQKTAPKKNKTPRTEQTKNQARIEEKDWVKQHSEKVKQGENSRRTKIQTEILFESLL